MARRSPVLMVWFTLVTSTPSSFALCFSLALVRVKRSLYLSAVGWLARAYTLAAFTLPEPEQLKLLTISSLPSWFRRYSVARSVGCNSSMKNWLGRLSKTQDMLTFVSLPWTQTSSFSGTPLKNISNASKIDDFPESFFPMRTVSSPRSTTTSSLKHRKLEILSWTSLIACSLPPAGLQPVLLQPAVGYVGDRVFEKPVSYQHSHSSKQLNFDLLHPP